MIWLSYLATSLVLTGVYFISKPKVKGQYLTILADCTWLAYGLLTKQWAIVIQSVILLKFALSAVKNWKKEGIYF